MRVVVTGGAGKVGRWVVREVLNDGDGKPRNKVRVFDRVMGPEREGVEYILDQNKEKETGMTIGKMIARVFGHLVLAMGFIALAAPVLMAAVAGQRSRAFDEKAVADFYRGKTVSIIVGFAAGGGYDITARVIGKHLGNHIPGNPNVIVENRPGAGSLVSANLTYKSLRKDGTYIVTFNSQMVLQQLMGRQGIEFDGRHFNWLGSVSSSQERYACFRNTASYCAAGSDRKGSKRGAASVDSRPTRAAT